MKDEDSDASYFVIDGLFDIGTPRQHWGAVAISSLTGHEEYLDHQQRLLSVGTKFLTDVLAFADLGTAQEAFQNITAHKQEYRLRLVEISKGVFKSVIARHTAYHNHRGTPHVERRRSKRSIPRQCLSDYGMHKDATS